MKICIDAGHGGLDSGAVNGKQKEKDYTLAIAKRIANKLEALNYDVVMTREIDTALMLQKRCDIGNLCDVFVSVHLNSAENKNANGIETFMWKDKDKELATNIQNSLMKLLPNERNRGVKKTQFYVLKNTKVPAALVEVGFLSHDVTADKFNSFSYQETIANAIVNGILQTLT